MNGLHLIKAGAGDILQLQEISRLTFLEAFAAQNTGENMRKYLDESLSLDKLSVELSDPNTQFYLAFLENEVVGYLKVNLGQAQTELKDARALEIERIYVRKDYYGKEVAHQLYAKALQVAREAGVDYIWLGVWEHNPRAIRFYQKNGFVEFDRHIFHLGDDAQTDIMMKLDLRGLHTLPGNRN